MEVDGFKGSAQIGFSGLLGWLKISCLQHLPQTKFLYGAEVGLTDNQLPPHIRILFDLPI